MKLSNLFLALHAFAVLPSLAQPDNSTYYNPVLSGWHSDPSCTQVNGTFFCVTSTFISFPGLPIYASKDLVNWKHVSHVWSRDSQLPGITQRTNGTSSFLNVGQSVGMYAATIRYHDGHFYVACVYVGLSDDNFSNFIQGLVFNTTDPFDDFAWSDPIRFHAGYSIDPDLFWDDDGKLYVAMSGITLQELNVETGEIGQSVSIWNGTGDSDPEGPHIYKKDGWYYLLIAEGGTGLSHSITIARARNITGPYESYENNPILTNRNTTEYFQTVGHGDLFQDVDGNWWGVCLATRSGPEYEVYPMGRETVLFPVSWEEGEWPVLQPVRGQMSGWALPATTREIPGEGPFNQDPDEYDFEEGIAIPRNLGYYRVPQETAFAVTSKGLQIVPSRSNLTGDASSNETSGELGLAFIGRIQTDTLFTFSADLTFDPTVAGQEAGVSVFLTPYNHIDLGLVLLSPEVSSSQATSNISSETSLLALRFRAEGFDAPSPQTIPIPPSWRNSTIRLQIQATNDTYYILTAMLAANPNAEVVAATTATATLVSGSTGPFTGSLAGVYATCNGAGEGLDCPNGGKVYVNRWRYKGIAQYISATKSVPEI